MPFDPPRHVAIAGAGVIGACLAETLAGRGVAVTLIDPIGPASAASGKSGGFLALDWCDGSQLGPLARRGFELHAELAARPGAAWGYRPLETLAVAERRPSAGNAAALPWLGPTMRLDGRLGDPSTTAQIDPAAFTHAMVDAALAAGAVLRRGAVGGILQRDGRATGLLVDGAPLDADAVVLAMGPWSIRASAWAPLPRIHALEGNSLIFRPDVALGAHALFAEMRGPDGTVATPELFARADGTAFFSALSREDPALPAPGAVASDPARIEVLRAMAARLAPALATAEIVARNACHRPVTRDGLPLIGQIAGLAGAHVSTGHSVWGMLMAPSSAEALAELITDGTARRLDLRPFDPARLPPHRPG